MYLSLLLKCQGHRHFFVLHISADMPKSQCVCGAVQRRYQPEPEEETEASKSLGICLLLVPLWVTCWQILHSTKGKMTLFLIPRRGKTWVLWQSALWPRNCTLGVMQPLTAGKWGWGCPKGKNLFYGMLQSKYSLQEMLQEKCWGYKGLHRILQTESCTGSKVDMSAGDADVISTCCSGHRIYYLKCAKSRWHASEL